MKLKMDAFQSLVDGVEYEGVDSYLVDDNGLSVPYHLYIGIVESQNVAIIICKKMPVDGAEYEMYEFNGNKLLEHSVVRIKEVAKTSEKFKKYISRFENKEFQFKR